MSYHIKIIIVACNLWKEGQQCFLLTTIVQLTEALHFHVTSNTTAALSWLLTFNHVRWPRDSVPFLVLRYIFFCAVVIAYL